MQLLLSMDWRVRFLHQHLDVLQNPVLRMALRIVAESMPIPMPSHGSKESDIIFAAGVTAGYAHCLENLRKLSVTETAKEPEATFEKQY